MRANVYAGVINDKRKFVTVNDDYLLFPCDQANWGFVGHGSAMTAEAVIINELGRGVDRQVINDFLEERVAKWPGREGWVLTSAEIDIWLKERVSEALSDS